MKKRHLIFTLIFLMSVVSAEAAGRFYAGIALGETTVSEACKRVRSDCDDSDVGLKVFGGFQISRHWGLEAAYVDLGQVTAALSSSGTPSITARIEGFTLSGAGTVPLSKKFDFFAKAGLFRWQIEAARFGRFATQRQTQDGTDFTFGAGMVFRFTEDMRLRAMWEQFSDIGDRNTSDIHLFSGGMVLFF